jgi:hypothetical protein
MRKLNRVCLSAVALAIGSLGLRASAALVGYTGTGALAGTNAGNLNIGRHFAVSGTGVTLRDLGVWDSGGDGLATSHVVTLFKINSGATGQNANVTPIAGGSVTVPSGTAAPLDNGMRFTSLTSPIYLAPGNYSVVAYGLNVTGGDPFGNGGGFPSAGNVDDIRFDPFQFTANTSPTYPTQGDTNNHSSTSFRYDLGDTTPEPGSVTVLLSGAVVLLCRKRRGRA